MKKIPLLPSSSAGWLLIFEIVLSVSLAVFGCGIFAAATYLEGLRIFSAGTIITAFWMLEFSAPVIAILMLGSWAFKWPVPATWRSLALGVVAVASWLYATSSLMYVYDVGTSPVRAVLLFGVFCLILVGAWLLFKHMKTNS